MKIQKASSSTQEKLIQKLEERSEKFELNKMESEKECKKIYLEIMSNEDKRKKLYSNIDIEFQFIEGKMSEKQLNKHKQKIDKLLKLLNAENVTCEDLQNLYGVK